MDTSAPIPTPSSSQTHINNNSNIMASEQQLTIQVKPVDSNAPSSAQISHPTTMSTSSRAISPSAASDVMSTTSFNSSASSKAAGSSSTVVNCSDNKKNFKTEYKSKFTPFDQYVYNEVTDQFEKPASPNLNQQTYHRNSNTNNTNGHRGNSSTPTHELQQYHLHSPQMSTSRSNQDLSLVNEYQMPTVSTQDASVFDPNAAGEPCVSREPWYKEVVNRKEKANEYRFKSEVGHNSPLLNLNSSRVDSPAQSLIEGGRVVASSPIGNGSTFGADSASQTGDSSQDLASATKSQHQSGDQVDASQHSHTYKFTSHDYKRDHMIANMANNNNFKPPKEMKVDPRASTATSRSAAQVRARSQSTRRTTTANVTSSRTDQPMAKSNQTTPTRAIRSTTAATSSRISSTATSTTPASSRLTSNPVKTSRNAQAASSARLSTAKTTTSTSRPTTSTTATRGGATSSGSASSSVTRTTQITSRASVSPRTPVTSTRTTVTSSTRTPTSVTKATPRPSTARTTPISSTTRPSRVSATSSSTMRQTSSSTTTNTRTGAPTTSNRSSPRGSNSGASPAPTPSTSAVKSIKTRSLAAEKEKAKAAAEVGQQATGTTGGPTTEQPAFAEFLGQKSNESSTVLHALGTLAAVGAAEAAAQGIHIETPPQPETAAKPGLAESELEQVPVQQVANLASEEILPMHRIEELEFRRDEVRGNNLSEELAQALTHEEFMDRVRGQPREEAPWSRLDQEDEEDHRRGVQEIEPVVNEAPVAVDESQGEVEAEDRVVPVEVQDSGAAEAAANRTTQSTDQQEASDLVNGLKDGLVSAEDRFDSSERGMSSNGSQASAHQLLKTSGEAQQSSGQNEDDEPYSIMPTTYSDSTRAEEGNGGLGDQGSKRQSVDRGQDIAEEDQGPPQGIVAESGRVESANEPVDEVEASELSSDEDTDQVRHKRDVSDNLTEEKDDYDHDRVIVDGQTGGDLNVDKLDRLDILRKEESEVDSGDKFDTYEVESKDENVYRKDDKNHDDQDDVKPASSDDTTMQQQQQQPVSGSVADVSARDALAASLENMKLEDEINISSKQQEDKASQSDNESEDNLLETTAALTTADTTLEEREIELEAQSQDQTRVERDTSNMLQNDSDREVDRKEEQAASRGELLMNVADLFEVEQKRKQELVKRAELARQSSSPSQVEVLSADQLAEQFAKQFSVEGNENSELTASRRSLNGQSLDGGVQNEQQQKIDDDDYDEQAGVGQVSVGDHEAGHEIGASTGGTSGPAADSQPVSRSSSITGVGSAVLEGGVAAANRTIEELGASSESVGRNLGESFEVDRLKTSGDQVNKFLQGTVETDVVRAPGEEEASGKKGDAESMAVVAEPRSSMDATNRKQANLFDGLSGDQVTVTTSSTVADKVTVESDGGDQHQKHDLGFDDDDDDEQLENSPQEPRAASPTTTTVDHLDIESEEHLKLSNHLTNSDDELILAPPRTSNSDAIDALPAANSPSAAASTITTTIASANDDDDVDDISSNEEHGGVGGGNKTTNSAGDLQDLVATPTTSRRSQSPDRYTEEANMDKLAQLDHDEDDHQIEEQRVELADGSRASAAIEQPTVAENRVEMSSLRSGAMIGDISPTNFSISRLKLGQHRDNFDDDDDDDDMGDGINLLASQHHHQQQHGGDNMMDPIGSAATSSPIFVSNSNEMFQFNPVSESRGVNLVHDNDDSSNVAEQLSDLTRAARVSSDEEVGGTGKTTTTSGQLDLSNMEVSPNTIAATVKQIQQSPQHSALQHGELHRQFHIDSNNQQAGERQGEEVEDSVLRRPKSLESSDETQDSGELLVDNNQSKVEFSQEGESIEKAQHQLQQATSHSKSNSSASSVSSSYERINVDEAREITKLDGRQEVQTTFGSTTNQPTTFELLDTKNDNNNSSAIAPTLLGYTTTTGTATADSVSFGATGDDIMQDHQEFAANLGDQQTRQVTTTSNIIETTTSTTEIRPKENLLD